MILIIDNYDSFTYNLVQRLGELNPRLNLTVARNDQITLDEIDAYRPESIIISPGPCTPSEAGISVPCVSTFASRCPILGVCLGHQSIGQAFGARIVRAKRLMHGKVDSIHHDQQGLFAGLDSPLVAARYHSLVIDPASLPNDLLICAWSDLPGGDREIMAIRHRHLPIYGVQFHPESFMTATGPDLLQRFLDISATRSPG